MRIRHAYSKAISPVPERVRTALWFGAIALLPFVVFVYSVDTANWAYGATRILSGESIYRPLLTNPYGDVASRYVYLPTFAIVSAFLVAPFHVLGQLGAPELIATGGKRVVVSLWGYVAFLSLPVLVAHLVDDADGRFWGGLLILLTPGLWFRVATSGPDLLVIALALGSIIAARNGRWVLAGLVAGLSMFKFTGVPFGPALATYAFALAGRGAVLRVAAGGIVSQLPNVFYFLLYPEDLLLFVEHGSLSWYSGVVSGFLLQPINRFNAVSWYESVGFPAVLALLTLAAVAVAYWRQDLLAAYCVGYIATGMLPPVGETRVIVLQILLLVGFTVAWNRDFSRYLAGWLMFLLLTPRFLQLLNEGYITNMASELGIQQLWLQATQLMILVMVASLVWLAPLRSQRVREG